eukprot:TRINITY_DN8371_c0_g1_i2.p1 TRINITY_DN8371_c0_g1~~TRINITY_DN8371_c0_g1_i2.p1  ORF type:complete len:575 (-),score=75.04 TRINITY_DN8371_c0_g1_i2:62-1786(-)
MGFSIDLFENKGAASSYICPVCLDVVENPMFPGKCDHFLCEDCMEGINRCPMKCKAPLKPRNPTPAFLKPYNALRMTCDICGVWKGSLGELSTHYDGGCALPIQCSNKGCEEVRAPDDMDLHLQLCSQRILPCPHCKKDFTYEKLKEHFAEYGECEEYPFPCDNDGCDQIIPSKHTSTHYQECPFSEEQCEWCEFGCDHKAPRKDMKSHHTDSTAQHVQCVKNVFDKVLAVLPPEYQEKVKRVLEESNVKDPEGPQTEKIDRETFKARFSDITDGELLKQIAPRYNTLTRLDFFSASKLTDASITKILQNITQLDRLDLSGVKITDNSILALVPNCKKLSMLDLKGCKLLTDKSMVPLAQHCTFLHALFLDNCNQITDKSIIRIARNCPKLHILGIQGCVQITDESIISLSNNREKLNGLDLNRCVQISDRAIISLAQGCRDLEWIQLEGCNLTDASVAVLAQHCTKLATVDLTRCDKITDISVLAFAQNCKFLSWLDLTACTQITDASIIPLSQKCPQLQTLRLACSQVTDNSVISLVKNCLELQELVLLECENVSVEILQELQSLEIQIEYS